MSWSPELVKWDAAERRCESARATSERLWSRRCGAWRRHAQFPRVPNALSPPTFSRRTSASRLSRGYFGRSPLSIGRTTVRPGLDERSNYKLVYIFYSPHDFSVTTRRGLARRPRGPRAPLNSRATLGTHRWYGLSGTDWAYRRVKGFGSEPLSGRTRRAGRTYRERVGDGAAKGAEPGVVRRGRRLGLGRGRRDDRRATAGALHGASDRRAATHNPLPPLHKPHALARSPAAAARSHLSVVAAAWHRLQLTTITLNNYRKLYFQRTQRPTRTNFSHFVSR